ncbi:TetR/AcrR family transcriptional regulator [Mycolicibacterium vulneris]|uniref:HTH tetR-type domain-containing protein n=1 Tax=Mycolicibacterium vulneris TaxID=547163 RepID=A0A1X2KJM6_9MYCO|nr:TetR/AcrR family transcriptional regulator [Mycolicibacterium vulneris]OSC21194.1 hypothetical protein B8W69_28690 [Mycolicibacterium vulneris]
MSAADDNQPMSPRRRLPAAERRKRILAEARAAFLETGGDLKGVSVRAIAQRCGVDQALVFRHFKTKEGLYREAVLAPIQEVVNGLVENAEKAALSESESERIERITTLTRDVVFAMCSLPPDVVRTVAMLFFGKTSDAAEFYKSTLQPTFSAFEAIVVKELPHWEHRAFSESLSVRMLVSTCFWISVEGEVSGSPLDCERTAAELTSLMLHGMVKREDHD